MFAFFLQNNFLDFWGNKPGDIFADITIEKLQWNKEKISLFYYPSIPIARPEYFYFDENKNLIIQEKVISTQDDIEVEEMVTINTIAPVIYVNNGQKILSC